MPGAVCAYTFTAAGPSASGFVVGDAGGRADGAAVPDREAPAPVEGCDDAGEQALTSPDPPASAASAAMARRRVTVATWASRGSRSTRPR
jgi:hypothetical protein